jgi:hypothetical protein
VAYGGELTPRREVDTEEARVHEGRAREPKVNRRRPGLTEHDRYGPARGSAHDRVVDDDDATTDNGACID